ncbi:MAG: hypothetical protein HFJ33_05555 [Clostridia bacterium]|nr:hypothetical protein [Clostridia bacterium]
MNTFADYILEEKELDSKMEITYYLSKKSKIFFDKSVVLKAEIVRLFLNYAKIDVDKNFVLTACLLCNCKKVNNAQDIHKIHSYAKEGAEYLRELGFGKRFCKVCEEINRYSESNPRERESDILELVDQFGGMLLDRPERIGFKPDEALVLLEHRNLKAKYNRYLQTFIEFVNFLEKIQVGEKVNMTALRRLVKIHNETNELTKFIQKLVYEFEPKIDQLIAEQNKEITEAMLNKVEGANRPLFSEETTRKIMALMDENTKIEAKHIKNS